MVEIQRCQFLKLSLILVSVSFNDVLEEFLHLRDVIDENLNQIFNSDPLLFLQLVVLVSIRCELLLLFIFDECAYNISDEVLQLVQQG